MLETLKSIAFVIITVMIALVLQAHAGKFAPDSTENPNEMSTYEQLQVYN